MGESEKNVQKLDWGRNGASAGRHQEGAVHRESAVSGTCVGVAPDRKRNERVSECGDE